MSEFDDVMKQLKAVQAGLQQKPLPKPKAVKKTDDGEKPKVVHLPLTDEQPKKKVGHTLEDVDTRQASLSMVASLVAESKEGQEPEEEEDAAETARALPEPEDFADSADLQLIDSDSIEVPLPVEAAADERADEEAQPSPEGTQEIDTVEGTQEIDTEDLLEEQPVGETMVSEGAEEVVEKEPPTEARPKRGPPPLPPIAAKEADKDSKQTFLAKVEATVRSLLSPVEKNVAELQRTTERLGKRLEALYEELEGINEVVDSMDEEAVEEIGALKTRMEGIEGTRNDLDSSLNGRMQQAERDLTDIRGELYGTEDKKGLNTEIEDLKETMRKNDAATDRKYKALLKQMNAFGEVLEELLGHGAERLELINEFLAEMAFRGICKNLAIQLKPEEVQGLTPEQVEAKTREKAKEWVEKLGEDWKGSMLKDVINNPEATRDRLCLNVFNAPYKAFGGDRHKTAREKIERLTALVIDRAQEMLDSMPAPAEENSR